MASNPEAMPQRFGPFILLRVLGSGGMGIAYLARHPTWPTNLVLKRMHAQYLNDETTFKRFLHEAKAATAVRHPCVASAMAVGTVGREPFFATEFVFGLPASQLVERIESSQTDPMPLGVGLYLALDLVKGLEAIHEASDESGRPLGLMHRDISTRNVLVGYDGRLRIIDLGLGKSILSDWETAANTVAGSPDYMPPEQAVGERVDQRADIYSAAVTIWEMLAGRKRIRAKTVAERLRLAIEARAEPLCSIRTEVSKRLELGLQAAMAPELTSRTSHIRDLRLALENELSSFDVAPRRRDVVTWLEVACATAIAKDKRALREVESLAARELDPVSDDTQIFAAQSTFFTSPVDEDPEAEHAVSSPSAPSGAADRPAPSLIPPSVEHLSSRLGTGGWLGVVALLAGILLFLVAMSLRSAAPPPSASSALRLAEPPPPRPPAPVGSSTRSGPSSNEALDAGTAPEPELAASEPEKARPEAPMSDELRARKRVLARRMGRLRRASFDVDWQRKLTRLGKQLAQARSDAQLDSIESKIRRLEGGR